jgi:hypothetical protein
MIVGYGTQSANAIHANKSIPVIDIPRKVIAFGVDMGRCIIYTLYFMKKTKTHYYINAPHFSLYALYEHHLHYLNMRLCKSRLGDLIAPQIRAMEESLNVLTKIRLIRLMVEEHIC